MKVKICGFIDPADVKIACDMGADMIGAILVPESKRYLGMERARQILDAVPGKVARVAVVRPKDLNDLKRFDEQLNPDYLQIHLTFPPAELAKARGRLNAGLILVAPVPPEVADRGAVVENAIRVAEVGDMLLIDTKGPSGGGTGLTHDWAISREIRQAVTKPVYLAGGLKPSNVAEAIRAVRPDGVDVATGVEASSGRKDSELIREFIRAVRGR